MATTVSLYRLTDLAKAESKNEIIIDTTKDVEIHIIQHSDLTIIRFPFGSKFDLIDDQIIIHQK